MSQVDEAKLLRDEFEEKLMECRKNIMFEMKYTVVSWDEIVNIAKTAIKLEEDITDINQDIHEYEQENLTQPEKTETIMSADGILFCPSCGSEKFEVKQADMVWRCSICKKVFTRRQLHDYKIYGH